MDWIKEKTDSIYLKLTGGEITGQIIRNASGKWVADRDMAAVFTTVPTVTEGDTTAYSAVAGVKTLAGTWTMGTLSSSNHLYFNYVTDDNYNTGKNTHYIAWIPELDTNMQLIGVVSAGKGYLRLSDGTQICWGNMTQTTVAKNSTVTKEITYPVAFKSVPTTNLSIAGNANNNNYSNLVFHTTSRNTTGVTVYFKNASFGEMSPSGMWFSIGYWK